MEEGTVAIMQEILDRMRVKDPVRGDWYVSKLDNRTEWCDASNISVGLMLEI